MGDECKGSYVTRVKQKCQARKTRWKQVRVRFTWQLAGARLLLLIGGVIDMEIMVNVRKASKR